MGVTLDLEDYGPSLNLVERDKWGAMPPNDYIETTLMEPPVMFVRFTQTGTGGCKNNSECKRLLQDLQSDHIEQGASDIKFNFMVGGFGTIYEGRGWTKGGYRSRRIDASNCLDLAYIGTFSRDNSPSWDMVLSFLDLIKYGVKNNFISPRFMIV